MLEGWLLRHLFLCCLVLVHGDAEAPPEIGVADDHGEGFGWLTFVGVGVVCGGGDETGEAVIPGARA